MKILSIIATTLCVLLPTTGMAETISFYFKARLVHETYLAVGNDDFQLGDVTVSHGNNPYAITGGQVSGMASNFNALRDGEFHNGAIHIDAATVDKWGTIRCTIGGIDCGYTGTIYYTPNVGVTGYLEQYSRFKFTYGANVDPAKAQLFVGDEDSACSGSYLGQSVFCGADGPGGYLAVLDLIPMPVPAGFPMLLAGVVGFGVIGRRRARG